MVFTRRRKLLAIAGALALSFAGAPAFADITPDDLKKKEAEREEQEKAPDAQGFGEGMEQGQERNPLPDIIELMRQVEQRLAEAETDRWTQEEQERIVKALEGQQSAVDRLKKLIEEAENQSQSGGGGGQDAEQRSQRESQRRQERQRERQREQQRQPANPQDPGQQRQPRSEREQQRQREEQQQRRTEEQPREQPGALRERQANPAEQWGNLPPKQRNELIDARKRAMPARWKKQLEEYYRRLAETERD